MAAYNRVTWPRLDFRKKLTLKVEQGLLRELGRGGQTRWRTHSGAVVLETFFRLVVISRLLNSTTVSLPFLHLVLKVILNDRLTAQGQAAAHLVHQPVLTESTSWNQGRLFNVNFHTTFSLIHDPSESTGMCSNHHLKEFLTFVM